jgi:hypothetical protein
MECLLFFHSLLEIRRRVNKQEENSHRQYYLSSTSSFSPILILSLFLSLSRKITFKEFPKQRANNSRDEEEEIFSNSANNFDFALRSTMNQGEALTVLDSKKYLICIRKK